MKLSDDQFKKEVGFAQKEKVQLKQLSDWKENLGNYLSDGHKEYKLISIAELPSVTLEDKNGERLSFCIGSSMSKGWFPKSKLKEKPQETEDWKEINGMISDLGVILEEVVSGLETSLNNKKKQIILVKNELEKLKQAINKARSKK